MMSTNFGLYGLLQIVHQNQLASRQELSASSQVEDLYQRRMYGLNNIQQESHIVTHQIYKKKHQKMLTNNYINQQLVT